MTKELLNYFRTKYKDLYEDNYPVVWGRDMAIMKGLLGLYDADKLKQYIDTYFSMENDFINKAGHKLQLIKSQLPTIQAQIKKEAKEVSVKTSDAERIALASKNLETQGDF